MIGEDPDTTTTNRQGRVHNAPRLRVRRGPRQPPGPDHAPAARPVAYRHPPDDGRAVPRRDATDPDRRSAGLPPRPRAPLAAPLPRRRHPRPARPAPARPAPPRRESPHRPHHRTARHTGAVDHPATLAAAGPARDQPAHPVATHPHGSPLATTPPRTPKRPRTPPHLRPDPPPHRPALGLI